MCKLRPDTPHGLPFSLLTLVVLFAVLWCAVSFLTSLMSGWFALSTRFRTQSEPYGDIRSAGPLFWTAHMRFGTHYSNLLCITTDKDGLSLYVMFPFRIGHPPLHIPWGGNPDAQRQILLAPAGLPYSRQQRKDSDAHFRAYGAQTWAPGTNLELSTGIPPAMSQGAQSGSPPPLQ
jgi:hypothetical protein